MENQNDSNSNPAVSTEAAVNENATTTNVERNDVSSTVVESQSKGKATELPLQNKSAQPTAETGVSKAPSVSKKVGNQNARKHGLYSKISKYAVLPWESEDEFNSLREEFRDEWKPNGASEEQAILDLTLYTWLRLRAVASARFNFSNSTVSDELKSGECSLDDIIQHQTKVPGHARAALSAAERLINDLGATHEKIREHYYWTKDSEGKEIQQKLMVLRNDVSTLIEQTKKGVIEGVRALVQTVETSAGRFKEAYQADEIEKQVVLLGRFDASVEKVIRRLIQTKVSKRIDGVGEPAPRLVESPSIVLIDNPTEKSPAEVDENTNAETSDKAGKPVAHAPPEYRSKPKAD